MKHVWKKLALFFLTVCGVFLLSLTAQAAIDIPTSITCSYQTANKDHNGIGLVLDGATKNTKIKNLKSSNTKIVKASWSKKQYDMLEIDYYKVGKAYITGDLYNGSKKVKSFKIKVNVIKYVSPVKSFKIGSKDYASKLKKASQYYLDYKGTLKGKVSIKANSGWKLKEIEFLNNSGNVKTIKNGTTITCKKDWHYVNAHFFNSKLNRYESVIIYLRK